MFAKGFLILALAASTQAGVFELGQQATSYSSIDRHDTHAAPIAHYTAPALIKSTYTPVIKAVPLVKEAHATSYSSINRHEPAYTPISHVAAPVATYHQAAPVATYHQAVPVTTYHHSAPVATYHATPVVKEVHQEVYADAHPHYSFQYGVEDTHTGDIKNQHEERDGDVVKGVYSLVQPDGLTRTVHYTSDHHNGFNAQVEFSGKALVAKAIVPAKVVAAPVYEAYHH